MIKRTVFLLVCFLTLFASAAFAETEVSITNGANKISVKVSADVQKDPLTLKIFKLNEAQEDGEDTLGDVIHVAQTDEPSVASDGRYVYEFEDFGKPESGKYRAVIGGNIAVKDFRVVTAADKAVYYKGFASASDIKGYIQQGIDSEILGFDIGNYMNISEDALKKVNDAIAAIDWASVGENPDDAQIEEYEAKLKPIFEEIIKIGDIIGSGEASFATMLRKNASSLEIDLKYFNDEEINLDSSKVYASLMKIMPNADRQSLSSALNVAVLIAVARDCDYGLLTEALEHYDNNGITLDKTYSSKLTDTQLQNVSIEMKKEAGSFTDAKSIEEAYLKHSKKIANETKGGNTTVSTGRGGTGSSHIFNPNPSGNGNVSDSNTEPVDYTVKFEDLSDAEWASEAIKYLAKKGVLTGKNEKEFCPNQNVTREEFTKIIISALELSDEKSSNRFHDVESGRWSEKYISSAVHLGIVSGVTDVEFMPETPITREQMAAIIYRALMIFDKSTGQRIVFDDDSQISDFAKDAVQYLAGRGIISGVGNNIFSPKAYVTRAQAAKIVYELLKTVEEA